MKRSIHAFKTLGAAWLALGIVTGAAWADTSYDVNPGNADDAAVINAAIVAAADEGGSGRVTLAMGTYNLTTPVLLNAAVELVGNDADRAQVVFDGAGKYRLIEVTHNDAFAHGITFQNGYSDLTSNWAYGPVYIKAGCVSNCVQKAGRGKFCGGVGLAPKKTNQSTDRSCVQDMLIMDCTGSDTGGAGIGGGLRLIESGIAIADRCTVTNCYQGNGFGAYVNNDNAQLLNSTICDGPKGGLMIAKNGIVSNCVIRGNYGRTTGGGVNMTAGTLTHCLVEGNAATTSGGGIQLEGGTVDHCTIVNNDSTGIGPGVYQTKGTIKNSIAWHNGACVYLSNESSLMQMGGTCTYTCAAVAPSGAGNVTDRLPAFADIANGDWSLTAASPCRGVADDGSDLGWRPYATPTTPRVSFTYAITDGKPPQTTMFTANVEGATATSYSWDFGDGAAIDTTSGATCSHTYATAGHFTVRLTVATGDSGNLTYEVANAVNLGAETVYVNPDGTGAFPYATPETACADIQTAIDAVIASSEKPGKVMLAASEKPYLLGSHDCFILTRPVEVIGAGPDATTIDCKQVSGKTGFLVQHDQAAVSSLRIYRGQWKERYGGGGANIVAGTITNCVFDTCRGTYNGSVALTGAGAKLVDCRVTDGRSTDTGNAGRGAGVYLTAGTVAGCTVENCEGKSNGGGIYAEGGLVTNSVIRNCWLTNNGEGRAGGLYVTGASTKAIDVVVADCTLLKQNGSHGGGGVYIDNGTLANAVVTNCTTSYLPGGGIYQAGGTVTRTIVVENSAATSGGGVYQKGGTLDHVTIARNNAVSDGSGVYQTKGAIKNTIIAENGNRAGMSPTQLTSVGGTTTYSCASELTNGENGNLNGDPKFRKPEENDFSLASSSPCIGKAEDGDDMGAIPYVYDPTAEPTLIITVATTGLIRPVVVTNTVSVDGELPGAVSEYIWTLGDGTVTNTTVDHVVYAYTSCGIYDVSVKIVLENGQTYDGEKKGAVSVYSDVAYVNAANDNPVEPYDTWAKAANTIGDALGTVYIGDKGYGTVYVAAGRYPLSDKTEYQILKDIHLVSASGKRDVVIDGTSGGQSNHGLRIAVNSEGALVSGLVVSNASVLASSWGVFDVAAGAISNCTAYGASGGYAGGGHAHGTGVLTDCWFEKCSSNDSNGGGHHSLGGFLVDDNALVENCVVTNCTGGSNAGGFQIDGGIVRRTTVVGCKGHGRTVFMTDGLVDSCRIVGNVSDASTNSCVGVYMECGTVRNSLVADNVAAEGGSAGIRATKTFVRFGTGGEPDVYEEKPSTIESCTIAGNVGTYAGLFSLAFTTWCNCLSSGNKGLEDVALGTFTTCYISDNARFRNPGCGNYRLRPDSPAIEAGTRLEWMTDDATDLAGKPRIFGEAPDIGCFETSLRGLRMIIR